MISIRILHVFLLASTILVACKESHEYEIEPNNRVYKVSLSAPALSQLLIESNNLSHKNGRVSGIQYRDDSAVVIQTTNSLKYSIPITATTEGASENLLLVTEEGILQKATIYSLQPDFGWVNDEYNGSPEDFNSFIGQIQLTDLQTGEVQSYTNKNEVNGRDAEEFCEYTIASYTSEGTLYWYLWIDWNNCKSEGSGNSGTDSSPSNGPADSGGSSGSSGSSGPGGGGSSSSDGAGTDSNSDLITIDTTSLNNIKCKDGFILDNKGNCVPECPPGHEMDLDGNCILLENPCVGDPIKNPEVASQNHSGILGGMFGCNRYGGICDGPDDRDKRHEGIDIKNSFGSPVYSMYDGFIYNTLYQANGAGYWTQIQCNVNGQTVIFQYFHLQSKNRVMEGRVKAGQIIGYQGVSGNLGDAIDAGLTESHVHIGALQHDGSSNWDYYDNFNAVDPKDYFYTDINNEGEASSENNCN